MKAEDLLATRECSFCKEMLNVYHTKDGPVAVEVASEKRHVCWDMPQDANLIVIEPSPEGP